MSASIELSKADLLKLIDEIHCIGILAESLSTTFQIGARTDYQGEVIKFDALQKLNIELKTAYDICNSGVT